MKGIQATREWWWWWGGVVYCALDASPCCRMIVWLERMIDVMLKGSEGKSWRTCPPTVTANKASLNMGLLKIHTKGWRRRLLIFSPTHKHKCTPAPFSFFFSSGSLMSKHLHIARYQWTFLQICALQLVLPVTNWPVDTSGIPNVCVFLTIFWQFGLLSTQSYHCLVRELSACIIHADVAIDSGAANPSADVLSHPQKRTCFNCRILSTATRQDALGWGKFLKPDLLHSACRQRFLLFKFKPA